MTVRQKHFIVSYDISDPLRLARIGKAMMDYGQRVLKSVFECTLDDRRFNEMKARVEDLMERESDSVRYYYICEKCLKLTQSLGKRQKVADEDFIILI